MRIQGQIDMLTSPRLMAYRKHARMFRALLILALVSLAVMRRPYNLSPRALRRCFSTLFTRGEGGRIPSWRRLPLGSGFAALRTMKGGHEKACGMKEAEWFCADG